MPEKVTFEIPHWLVTLVPFYMVLILIVHLNIVFKEADTFIIVIILLFLHTTPRTAEKDRDIKVFFSIFIIYCLLCLAG